MSPFKELAALVRLDLLKAIFEDHPQNEQGARAQDVLQQCEAVLTKAKQATAIAIADARRLEAQMAVNPSDALQQQLAQQDVAVDQLKTALKNLSAKKAKVEEYIAFIRGRAGSTSTPRHLPRDRAPENLVPPRETPDERTSVAAHQRTSPLQPAIKPSTPMKPEQDHLTQRTVTLSPEQSGLPFTIEMEMPAGYATSGPCDAPKLLAAHGPPGGPDGFAIYRATHVASDHDAVALAREAIEPLSANEQRVEDGKIQIAGRAEPAVLFLTANYGMGGFHTLATLWVGVTPAGAPTFLVKRWGYAKKGAGIAQFDACPLLNAIRVGAS